MKDKKVLFTNANIYLPNRVIEQGSLSVRNGRIEEILERSSADDGAADEVVDVRGDRLVPGFIDVHVHGGGGYDVMHGSPEDLDGMSQYHASKGTTSFLATTLTGEPSAIESAIRNTVKAIERGTKGAEIVGIHLEGPFLNPVRCGAQDPKYIRKGTLVEMKSYLDLAKGHVRLMTIAPEVEGNMDVIRYCLAEGITISLGHTDATYDVVAEAVKLGATHVTHLFNGMRPLHHREPGMAGAAMMLDELAVELICDGIHVRGELISFVFKVKPKNKVVMITDCVSAAGCPEGEYVLGQLPVRMQAGQVRLINEDGSLGNLAGSTLTLDHALTNALKFTGESLANILPALTINPATQIGIADRKGSIELGKDADFVLLDSNCEVAATYVQGRQVYKR